MYELVFSGSASVKGFPAYKREHATLDTIPATVCAVRERLEELRCHNPELVGPHHFDPMVYGSNGHTYSVRWEDGFVRDLGTDV